MTVLVNSNSNESQMSVNDQSHECHVTNGLSQDQLIPRLHGDEDRYQCGSPKPTSKRVTNGFRVPKNRNGTSPTVTKGIYMYVVYTLIHGNTCMYSTWHTSYCMLEVGRREGNPNKQDM